MQVGSVHGRIVCVVLGQFRHLMRSRLHDLRGDGDARVERRRALAQAGQDHAALEVDGVAAW